MKKIFSIILISTTLFSCSDKTQINLVSGILFEECNQVLENREIALKANNGGSFSSPIIIGSAVTKADGSFNFTYELEEDATGTGQLLLINQIGFKTLISEVDLNEDLIINLYNNDSIRLTVNLLGTKVYGEFDTLFFGFNRTSQEFSVIQPSNGEILNLQSTLETSLKSEIPPRVYYGLGKVDFEAAKAQTTASSLPLRNIELNLTPCNKTDTARITIN